MATRVAIDCALPQTESRVPLNGNAGTVQADADMLSEVERITAF